MSDSFYKLHPDLGIRKPHQIMVKGKDNKLTVSSIDFEELTKWLKVFPNLYSN